VIEKAEETGEVWLTCDDCGETLDFSSFSKAVNFKRRQKLVVGGWRTSRTPAGDFRDHCPKCTKKWVAGLG
jgi:hypothetical protein